MTAVRLITQAEYARRRGVDPTTVRDAIKAGRITLIDGKIDPDVADVQWQRNTRARVGNQSRPVDRPELEVQMADRPETYDEARRRRELAEAELAELKLSELRGDLVRKADVRAAMARKVASLREAFLQMPARLVPRLAADPSPARMDAMLREEITLALQQVSEG